MTRIRRTLAKGELGTAKALAERQIAAGEGHPVLYQALAEFQIASGRYREAGDTLNRGLALDRADPDCLCVLAILLMHEERWDEAVNVFAQTLRLRPNSARAWFGLGQALEKLENEDRALGAYQRAAAISPKDASPIAAVADLHWRDGRKDEARQAAAEALSLDPASVTGRLVSGRIALAEGRPADAQACAETVLARRRTAGDDHVMAQKLLADALDRQGRIPDAVNAYERMNHAAVEVHRARFGEGGRVENHLSFIARISAAYRRHAGSWRISAPETGPAPATRHVFVLGYPRSGNTLAAAVLGQSPGAVVLEEQPTLLDIGLDYLRDDDSVARLARAADREIDRLRGLYWDRVRRLAPRFNGGLFIDMAPMNGLNIPVIRRLFPKASIVVCRRDPRDVVLSCWRQPFDMSAATYQMTTIAGAARHFDATLRATADGLDLVGGGEHLLDYDRFMDDFEAGARDLFRAVGVEWTDRALQFADAGQTRRLRTASAEQIREGLFDGRGRWRRYEAYLEPVMPILRPWMVV